ncbi:hypothetical protein [Paenibacillus sp. Y412MC10]|uniref:hypothetical protein n=1 Tax=Geobacillus sp. (strain Y412MC10) TaxID=481743 RepID=UPI0011AB8551|nr:hypothetical protein [Paenibacillus sp. Y412MC10]
MSETFRFQHGDMRGEVKAAEPTDNPGELMILSMPLTANVDMSGTGGIKTDCPLCGKMCWATPLILQGAAIYPGRSIAACSECALRANLNKGQVPRWMKENGLTPSTLLQPIITLLK